MKDREIDIVELIAKIIKVLRKKILILVSLLIVFLGIGILKSYLSKPYYKIKMIASSTFVLNERIPIYIESLNNCVREDRYNNLANKMNISIEQCNIIKSFSAKPIIDDVSLFNIYKDKNPTDFNCIEITVELFDSINTESLAEGISYFISNIKYIREKTKQNKNNAELMIKRIDQEIAELDSLQSQIYNIENVLSSSGLYTNIIRLYEKKQEYEVITNSNTLNIIKEFNDIGKKENLGLTMIIVLSVILSVIFWLGFVFIIEIRNRVVAQN